MASGLDEIEAALPPLYRAPLSLAVSAAALKYVATVAVLRDPLLLTRADRARWRDATQDMTAWKRCHLAALLLFAGLAANNLAHDASALAAGVRAGLPGREWLHLLAMVVAFSPNTITAVAGAFILLARGSRRVDLSASPAKAEGLGSMIDLVSLVLQVAFTFIYVLPLPLVSMGYGIAGMGAIAYACCYDLFMMPWWFFHGGRMDYVWVTIPFVVAAVLSHLLSLTLIGGQAWLFERLNPQLASRIKAAGEKIDVLKVRLPERVPARILGRAHELATLRGRKEEFLATEQQEDLLPAAQGPEARLEAAEGHEAPTREATERCILNDDALAFFMYAKICICMVLPLLQVAVVVATNIYRGDGLWDAAQHVFGERTWAHYAARVRASGASGLAPLFWYYL